MEIKQGDTVRVLRSPGMPRMQALHFGQTGLVVDRYRIGDLDQYRVMLPGGSVDFMESEIEVLTRGAANVGY